MCMHIYVCMYMYIDKHVTYIYSIYIIHIRIYNVYKYINVCVNMYKYMYIYIYIYIY